jgi:hypothetical protein
LQGTPAAGAARRLRSTRSGSAVLDAVESRGGGAPRTRSTAARQLAPGSRFVRALAGSPLPEQIDLTAFGAVDDVVVPADHTGRADARTVTVDPAGTSDHRRILDDPRSVDAVRLALEGLGAPCVGIVDGVRGAVEPVVISRAERTGGSVGRTVGRAADAITERTGGRP